MVVVPAVEFFVSWLRAGGRAATHRSYGMDLLRWWRFLWATGVGWDQATRVEARDFCRWIGRARSPAAALAVSRWRRAPGAGTAVAPGTPNPVTGKRWPGGRTRGDWCIARVCCAGFTAST